MGRKSQKQKKVAKRKPRAKRVDKESKQERKWNINDELVKHNKCLWMIYRIVCHRTNQFETKYFFSKIFFKKS